MEVFGVLNITADPEILGRSKFGSDDISPSLEIKHRRFEKLLVGKSIPGSH